MTTKMAGGRTLRRGLVVLQFCIAQALIIAVLVVGSQLDYFSHASLGFDKEAIVSVPIPSDSVSVSEMDIVRNRLLQQPGIKNGSFSTFSPSDNDYWNADFKFDMQPKNLIFLPILNGQMLTILKLTIFDCLPEEPILQVIP